MCCDASSSISAIVCCASHGHEERVDFLGILLAHRAQVLVARLLRPRGTAHRVDQSLPLVARAPAQADLAVLAGQHHVRIRASRRVGAPARALPLEAVVGVDAAIAGDIACEDVGQRHVDHTSRAALLAHEQRDEAGGGEIGAALMLEHARRKRQRLALGLAERPRDGAHRLRVEADRGILGVRSLQGRTSSTRRRPGADDGAQAMPASRPSTFSSNAGRVAHDDVVLREVDACNRRSRACLAQDTRAQARSGLRQSGTCRPRTRTRVDLGARDWRGAIRSRRRRCPCSTRARAWALSSLPYSFSIPAFFARSPHFFVSDFTQSRAARACPARHRRRAHAGSRRSPCRRAPCSSPRSGA